MPHRRAHLDRNLGGRPWLTALLIVSWVAFTVLAVLAEEEILPGIWQVIAGLGYWAVVIIGMMSIARSRRRMKHLKPESELECPAPYSTDAGWIYPDGEVVDPIEHERRVESVMALLPKELRDPRWEAALRHEDPAWKRALDAWLWRESLLAKRNTLGSADDFSKERAEASLRQAEKMWRDQPSELRAEIVNGEYARVFRWGKTDPELIPHSSRHVVPKIPHIDRPFQLVTDCPAGHAAAHLLTSAGGGRVTRECSLCPKPRIWTENA